MLRQTEEAYMPLDFNVKPHLAEEVRWLGVRQVPDSVLEQHKRGEVAKHPADWGYQHPLLLAIGFPLGLFSGISGAITGICIAVDRYPIIGLMIAVASLLLLIILRHLLPKGDERGRVHLKGPAQWREWMLQYPSRNTLLAGSFGVPQEIATIALDLQSQIPGSWLVVGELRQNHRLLDPYLLLCVDPAHPGDVRQQICLGIWDGDTIIHKAEMV
jgi:hypothetical protein